MGGNSRRKGKGPTTPGIIVWVNGRVVCRGNKQTHVVARYQIQRHDKVCSTRILVNRHIIDRNSGPLINIDRAYTLAFREGGIGARVAQIHRKGLLKLYLYIIDNRHIDRLLGLTRRKGQGIGCRGVIIIPVLILCGAIIGSIIHTHSVLSHQT